MSEKVTAGLPITAVESVEEHFPLPASIVAGADQVFMLRISGDSMIEAGIFDGDLVVVRQQQSAYNGEIVVALTEDNEATVKRFYKEKRPFPSTTRKLFIRTYHFKTSVSYRESNWRIS